MPSERDVTERNPKEGMLVMKIGVPRILGSVAVAAVGALAVVGCGPKSGSEPSKAVGVGEKAGAALDRAAEKTSEVAKEAATATKDVAGQAVEKTGEALQKAGAAAEKTGAAMQK